MGINVQQARALLRKANIPFREETCISNGFWGRTIIVARKDWRRIDRIPALKDVFQSHFKEIAVSFFND